MDRLSNRKYTLYQVFLFTILVVFFCRVSPYIPYDGDDWYFAGSMRWPFPMWGVFNPSKVLPETLEPLCGYIAAYIVYPITGDYVGSLSLVMSFCIASISFAFCLMVYRFLTKALDVSIRRALAIETIILLSFFCIFKQRTAASYFALWSGDVNCCFNYVIPGMINGITVLALEIYSKETNTKDYLKKGLLVIGIYFSMFSSIQLNIILAVYAAVKILEYIFYVSKSLRSVLTKEFIRNNSWYLGVLATWCVTLLFEFNGGRAKVVSGESFWTQGFGVTLQNMGLLAKKVNPIFGAMVLAVLVIAIILSELGASKKNSFDIAIRNALRRILLIGSIMFIYLLLLYTKLGGGYASGTDCMWSIQFVVYWTFAVSLAEVVSKLNAVRLFVPLGIVVITTTSPSSVVSVYFIL